MQFLFWYMSTFFRNEFVGTRRYKYRNELPRSVNQSGMINHGTFYLGVFMFLWFTYWSLKVHKCVFMHVDS